MQLCSLSGLSPWSLLCYHFENEIKGFIKPVAEVELRVVPGRCAGGAPEEQALPSNSRVYWQWALVNAPL